MLGLDPLYVANEGKLLAIVDEKVAGELVAVMRQNPLGRDARRVRTVHCQLPRKTKPNVILVRNC